MKRLSFCLLIIVFSTFLPGMASAHFGMLIPSDQMITAGERPTVDLRLMFAHPFEGKGMDLERPAEFGVAINGKKTDILNTLKPAMIMNHKAWETKYRIKRPGIYMFYMEPKPYWEPAEDCYIIHYTKVVVSAYNLEEGWDSEIGLKTEIVPLSKPYGLYAGNVFQGIVKLNGKPVPFCEVEVEYFNEDGKAITPNDYMVTQTIKADKNGVFTYAAPRHGWWGFAALNTDEKKINGKDIEIGAVIWVKFHEMK